MLASIALLLMSSYPFQDPSLPTEQRIDNLLSLMTLDEKIECLGTNPSVPRLGIKACGHVEGLHGLAQGGPANWAPPRKVPTTTFPQSYGLGATWDPDLIRKVGAVEGLEARYIWQSPKYGQGAIVVRSPNADLGRDPRWGRTEECFGEDPYLTGSLVVGFVKGLQGDDPKYWQTASLLKHFLANSNEDGRDSSSSNFDERLWREYYSVPFRVGIQEGGSRAFMAAYNAYNGVPCHIHPMLEQITRKEWGQDGIICTDGGGMRLLVTDHKAFPDQAQATAAIVKAGVGQFLDRFRDPAHEAVNEGLMTEADIDKVLRGTFRVMVKLGVLDPPDDNPYAKIGDGPEPWESPEHKALAREVTRKSIVLLKNDGLLPLERTHLKRVAVVGKLAKEVLLDWYSGLPPYRVSIYDGIAAKLGDSAEVRYSEGVDEGVRSADVAIVVVGNEPVGSLPWAQVAKKSYGREAKDRESIDLEDEQLVREAFESNPRTVLVLKSSFPYAINWSQAHLPAILHLAHNSQEEGNAVADVLFGDTNPAGRLTQTWPKSLGQLPPMMDYDLRHGRTYLYAKSEPLYPFGFGLSYTSFEYRSMRVSQSGANLRATVEVSNDGKRDGEEVVQLYARFIGSKVERPRKQLVAFRRVPIEAGETKTVELEVPKQRLAYWDVSGHRWVVEPGEVELQAGRSSADIALRKRVRLKA